MTLRPDRLEALLRVYPKTYRDRRGEEIIGTLLDGAPTLSRYEAARAELNVVAHGLRVRLGIASDQLAGRVLAAAALPGMTMAAAVAVVMPFFAQLLPGIRHNNVDWGPDTAIVPGLFIVWIIGGLASIAFPRRRRLVAALCVTVTVATRVVVALSFGAQFDPAFSLLVVLALPALLAPRTSPRRSHRVFALVVGGLVLSILIVASLDVYNFSGPNGLFFYRGFSTFVPYVAGALIVSAAVLFASRRWITGVALALVTVPWLLFPFLEQYAQSTPLNAAALALGWVMGLGLLGAWFSQLWKINHAVR